MKILELKLLAFGPFSGTSLDLSGGDEGLHIVYGPNEAGKSTTLRALRALLFGIETRSADDHLHPYNDMRIGATLRFADGRTLQVVRRKGNKNTLRDGNDANPVDADLLAKALGHIDESAFKLRFGLSHQALVEGGEAIADGGGDLGEALFAAGAGIAHLAKLQARLREGAEALYKPQGRVPPINAALAKYNERARSLRTIQLSADDWLRRERELADAKAHFDAIEQVLAALETTRQRFDRFEAALPLASRRTAKLAELVEIGAVPTLSRDFSERREQAAKRLQSATEALSRARQDVDRIDARLAELGTPPPILEHAAAVNAICRDLSSHVKANKDRADLASKQEQLGRQTRGLLEKIGRKSADDEQVKVVVRTAERARIEELSGQFRDISARCETAKHRRTQLERRIAEAEAELARHPAVGDDDSAKRLLKRLQPLLHSESPHALETKRLDADEEQLAVDTARLPHWDRDLNMLERLSVPENDVIQRYEAQLGAGARAVEKASQHRDALAAEAAEVRQELAAIQASSQPPTERELADARQARDAAWQAIRDALTNGDVDSAKSLAANFEPRVAAADAVVDRMRRDADVVAKRCSLDGLLAKRADEITRADDELQHARDELSAIERKWTELWQAIGISPGTSREMHAWLTERQKLCDRAAALRQRRAEHAAVAKQLEEARAEAIAALEALGGRATGSSLSHVADALDAVCDQIASFRARRQTLEATRTEAARELAEVNEEIARTEAQLVEWRQAWTAAVEPLGHDDALTPAQAQALLGDLAELRGLIETRAGGAERIAGIDRDTREYCVQVVDVATRSCCDLDAQAVSTESFRAVESLVGELDRRLVDAREADAERRKLLADRQRIEGDLAALRQNAGSAETAIADLCREAAADSASDLPGIEERWRRQADLRGQVAEIDEALAIHAAGAPLEAFLGELSAVDADGLASEQSRLAARHAEATEKCDAIRKQVWDLDRDSKANLGRDDAAVANAQLQEQKAQLEEDVARYARLRLASSVLQLAIERYRKDNQAPLLTRASGIFSGLTCGEFIELRADFDDERPVLVAVRSASSKHVRVSGMSDGTCDQLYLALRLASVEQYIDQHPPIPFIVDDVLQRFDDGRASAALTALAALSKKTQVIFFTHHRHVLDLAAKQLGRGEFFSHSLGSEEAGASPPREKKRAAKKVAEPTLFQG
jgi:uncharacterized protein YhaN